MFGLAGGSSVTAIVKCNFWTRNFEEGSFDEIFDVFRFNIVFFWCKVNFIYRKHRNCFGNFFQSTTNCVVSPFLKFRKNISNFPFKISKSVLTLYMPNPQNGQTHSSNLSTICQRIVWVCLAILLRIKMTFVQTIPLR